MNVRALLILILTVLASLAPASVRAQDAPAPATVAGAVRDGLGGSIPGATIRVVNETTNAAVETVTDLQGAYRVGDLRPGPYRVEITLSGFETVLRRVTLTPGQTTAVDAALVVSRFSEGIVVTARRVEEEAQDVPIPVSVVTGT